MKARELSYGQMFRLDGEDGLFYKCPILGHCEYIKVGANGPASTAVISDCREVVVVRYHDLQDEWIRANDIRVGSRVRVTGPARLGEMGWDSYWQIRMNDFIGKEFDVSDIESGGLELGRFRYSFPYFVLDPVQPELRAFNGEECPGLIGKHVKDEYGNAFTIIRADMSSCLGYGWVYLGGGEPSGISTGELLEKYKFLDDSPCGVVE